LQLCSRSGGKVKWLIRNGSSRPVREFTHEHEDVFGRLIHSRDYFGWLLAMQEPAKTRRLTSLGYSFLPAATWLMADLQSSLRLVRVDLIQANFAVRRRASAQRCFTSFVHAFAAAAVRVNKF
jgi:hypothetical protein